VSHPRRRFIETAVIVGATLVLAISASAHAAPPLGDRSGRSRAYRSDAPALSARHGDSSSSRATDPHLPSAARSPTEPPLLHPGASAVSGGDEPQAGGSPGTEADPLVSNGLGSPLCSGPPGGSALSSAARRNCETSGFVAAAAPTGNFGIDVHIDTGPLGLSSAQLLVIVQNLLVTPLWMALVWAAHALVVMLEWCFTIDLLEGDTLRGGVASGLHEMQATVTMPWLAMVLAIAAVLCAYQGLIRRRVAESLAQALMALAMMAGGLWVTVDPAGTVGALGDWANRASLGTLAVTARGSPGDPGGALAASMGLVFATAIEVPWCYLEFGDVDWCRNQSRLDPRLRAAALALASSELDGVGCRDAPVPIGCSERRGTDATAIEHSARLLRAAHTNGAIFLALPPNGPERNAINDPTSLLRAICRSETATDCHGSAAAAAEFRTNHGTWSRVGGLLLITAGVLGMLLLLCFLALRLLGAAIFSLVYLMLAPAAALAPALGETGRAVFRKWATQLFAAVVSKLLFAFLLGVVLGVLAILEHLEALGWWTRWLLMSAFWWGLFARRHQVVQLASGARGDERARGVRRPVLRRVNETLDARARMQQRVRSARERSHRPAPDLARETAHTPRGLQKQGTAVGNAGTPGAPQGATIGDASRSGVTVGAAAAGSRTARSGDGRSHTGTTPNARAQPSSDGADAARLSLIADQRAQALAAGNTRRAARLATRKQRIELEASSEVGGDRRPERAVGRDRADAEARHARFLDAQARLAAGRRGGSGGAPSYAALAGIAGYGARDYKQLDAAGKRVARGLIDRELAVRREHAPPRLDRRPGVSSRSESEVMRDAREVAAGRKRQLGTDRP
jgi:hypothetical protein